MEKVGIEQLKDMVGFALALGNSFGSALSDGKLGLSDIPTFIAPLSMAPAAFAGVSQVPAELKDLDEAEKGELMAFVKEKFDLADDKVESAVEDGLKLVGDIHGFVVKYFTAPVV